MKGILDSTTRQIFLQGQYRIKGTEENKDAMELLKTAKNHYTIQKQY